MEPKCFLNCVFQECGIISEEGKIDEEAADYYFSALRARRLAVMGDIVRRCAKSADDETEKCERAYAFGKCNVEELSRRFKADIIAEL